MEWVTLFKNKPRDPFKRARWKIALLYLAIGTFISIVFDLFLVDNALRGTLYQTALLQTGDSVARAFHEIKVELWLSRAIKLILFSASTFFLAGYVLKPIRKNAELQKRFVSMVSHELRTPLAIAKNASEVALRKGDALTREEAIAVLVSNLEETNRIISIIEFLLAYSNSESEKKNLRMEKVSLISLAQSVISLMQKESDAARVKLVLQHSESDQVRGNFTALEEMLSNLVGNAIAYTPEQGSVIIRIEPRLENQIALSVIDEGEGILEEDLPNLFEPFYRGKNQILHTSKNGLGLGLSIVKDVVHLHRAEIIVDNNQGQGSVFTVLFKAA